MVRQRAFWLTIILFVLSSLACNAFAGGSEPTLPSPPTMVLEGTPDTGTPEGDESSDGLAPTATLPGGATAESTAASPSGEASLTVQVDLNVRTGPGVIYERVGFLLQGESARIVGRDPESGWWKIECPSQIDSSECWVSGSPQYTVASGAENVPTAIAPPTPTPASVRPAPGKALLAYTDSGRLWAVTLNLADAPPTADEPRLLVDSTDVQEIFISPDGSRIAYLQGTTGANELRVVNIDGTDMRILARSSDLPLANEEDSASFAAIIGQVQWLADSQTLVFNTSLISLVGPGLGSQEDLWTVKLAGQPQQVFEAGSGGGAFAVSTTNQVIMSRAEEVVRGSLDGNQSEVLIRFDFINTASEYIYYPRPQWTADGSQAYVAIPSQEQFAATADATLWRIPTTGSATEIGSLPGNILFNPVIWTANGEKLAYVQQIISPTNPSPVLTVADSNGENATPYRESPLLQFHEWSPDNSSFLFSGEGFYAVGQLDQPAVNVSVSGGQAVGDARWLTADAFVVVTGSLGTDAWNFVSGNPSGTTESLVTTQGALPSFDVWAP